MSTLPPLWLDHVNLPARDPEVLAQWYADRLGMERRGGAVMGPGVSIFFKKGAPLAVGDAFHFGLRVETKSAVEAWAEQLGVPIAFDEDDFFAARVTDPEGNTFEVYWDKL
jgi:catechol 2,3-dioxygenase-like lactoylglutathione lyase family enzyme